MLSRAAAAALLCDARMSSSQLLQEESEDFAKQVRHAAVWIFGITEQNDTWKALQLMGALADCGLRIDSAGLVVDATYGCNWLGILRSAPTVAEAAPEPATLNGEYDERQMRR